MILCSSTDSDNVDEETLQKRPAKKSHRPLKNPFFGEGAKKSKSPKAKFDDEDETDSWSDDSDGESDFSDTDSGEDEKGKFGKRAIFVQNVFIVIDK